METNYWAMFMEVNMLEVLVCGIAAMAVGFIWYGPLFGKAWMEIMGADKMTSEERQVAMRGVSGMYALQFLLSLITAFMLSSLIGQAPETVYLSIFTWFSFVMTTTAGSALWSGKPKKIAWRMFLISSGAQLVTFIVFGLIIGGWK